MGGEPAEQTLADLQPVVIPEHDKVLPRMSLDQLSESYREVLSITDDPEIRVQVLQRLAGLEMLRGEQKRYDQQAEAEMFGIAIAAYGELLRANPDRADNDRLLYQLSKAYDLSGEPQKSLDVLNRLTSQYPHSEYYVEAQFRRAEIYFIDSRFSEAELAYAAVVEHGKDSSYYQNALYMHDWSQFKRESYRASLKSFTETLDQLVPADNDLASLPRGERELVDDSLRVMSIVFSYLDGPQTIQEVYSSLGHRHYEPLLYDQLGKLYLEKEQYRDSADTYRAFVKRFPQSDLAPVYYGHIINAYQQAGFSEEVLAEKENYVRLYGIDSSYWALHKDNYDKIKPNLKIYLSELARHYHALAQTTAAPAVEAKNQPASSLNSEGPDQKLASDSSVEKPFNAEKNRQLVVSYYGRAGDYYQQFILSSCHKIT